MPNRKKTRTRIAFELPKDLREQLERMAESEDRSLSASIRQILMRAVEAQEKTA